MTYSARNKEGHLQISIAVSEDPLGPFKDCSENILRRSSCESNFCSKNE